MADRFLCDDDESDGAAWVAATAAMPRRRSARDLASGEMVTLVESSAGGPTEQLQWSLRCGRFASSHHAHLAALVDFGGLGDGRRFEAWRGAAAWCGDPALAAQALTRCDAYLRASGCAPCRDAVVVTWDGRPMVIPDAAAGRECEAAPAPPPPERAWEACGIESVPRAAVQALVEMLHDPGRREPRALALWGGAGSGLRVAARHVARAARVAGFVPVAAGIDDRGVWSTIGDRSVVVIDRRDDGHGWRRLLEAASRRGRAHMLVIASTVEVPRVHNVRLEPIAADVLVDAVGPHEWQVAHRTRIVEAARRADGSPARFAARLWGRAAAAPPSLSAAAERPPLYAGRRAPAGGPRAARAWPVSGDIAALRHSLTAALRRLQAGRVAAAERDIRSSVAALVRRQDLPAAVQGFTALADAQLRRGRVGDARRLIDDARGWAESTADPAALGRLSLVLAAWHVHVGALGEAEAVARSVLAAALARDDAEQAVAAAVTLSRALFWQARFAPALDVIVRLDDGRRTDGEVVGLSIGTAYAALGQSTDGAPAAAARARAAAQRLGDPAWQARAWLVSACTQLVAGDTASTRHDAAHAVARAHAAHDPLLALRARWIAAEAHRRDGRNGPAVRLLNRLQRVPRASLPASLAARVSLLGELVGGGAAAAVAARLAAATGLPALTLFAPRPAAAPGAEPRLDDMLDIVSRLQDADDDAAALTAMCAAVRGQLQGLAVGVVVADGTAARVIAADGPRVDVAVAQRAMELGQLVTERPAAAGVGAGAPVRYAGRILGALVARWSPGAAPPADRVAAWLTMASALAAPAVAVAARSQPPLIADELVGVSDAIAAVRQAVERAAPVSYPVLIEGESGSGKELVARALHRRGTRRDRAFVAVNCAAVPDDLMEAEFFGHARGAFTGAMIERAGVFEEAHGGTLFLDEVGELSPRAQAKLLRTVQEGEVRRVGENVSRRVDVRIVAATNRHLRQEVAAGRFRLDLLYRLDVVRITVPPLRERIADLPLLIERCWREATERVHSRAVLSAATMSALAGYRWPGNVRELQNVMAALAVRVPRRGIVTPSALPWGAVDDAAGIARLDAARRAFDARFVQAALVRAGGHRGRAARELGLSRQGLGKLLARLGIDENAGAGG